MSPQKETSDSANTITESDSSSLFNHDKTNMAKNSKTSDENKNSENLEMTKTEQEKEQKQTSTETAATPDTASTSAAADTEAQANSKEISKERAKDVLTNDQKNEQNALQAKDSKNHSIISKEEATQIMESRSDLPTKDDRPLDDTFNAKVVVITSGKGGVGKTTSAAAISTGLAMKGHKTVVIDFDVGLRNLDLLMGCERRVVFNLIDVIQGNAKLNQALIKDKNCDNLYILAASQVQNKNALSYKGVGKVLKELSEMGFEYLICDSPAGIESGALIALYYADIAIVTINPEISSLRDSDRVIGILNACSRRAVKNWDPIDTRLLLTRYEPERVQKEEMLSLNEIQGLLNAPILGVIPESKEVLNSSNNGISIILDNKAEAGQAYVDAVDRLLGNEVALRFVNVKKGFWNKIFGWRKRMRGASRLVIKFRSH